MANFEESSESKFKELLEAVAANITPNELSTLKRLCSGKIAEGRLCKMETGDLFIALLNANIISPKNTTFLATCLRSPAIGKKTLADKLTTFSQEISNTSQGQAGSSFEGHKGQAAQPSSQTIPAFKTLLKEISDDLSPNEVEEMKNLVIGVQLPRKDEHEIKNGMDLFIHLEKTGAISDTKVDLLVRLLTSIGRQPLVDKVKGAFR
ncbi:uncharacterized protein LOC102807942 [Saccoglossus kowalevskii]|uniref:Uncharacterized protein LOC102807942 n=1 Tax=Saccoglossus kowalevskii TaxID=10224 RepID=A0ABM0MJE6_SACKO|nr:PREDICTED: uncharacterized protein LOC102807942 [Saccoglossus kowalevskii]